MPSWSTVDSANTSLSGKPIGMLRQSSVVSVSNGVSLILANTANIVYGVSAAEIANTASRGIAHTGWVKIETGTGGRAGRKQIEVLVAGGITGDDAGDDAAVGT